MMQEVRFANYGAVSLMTINSRNKGVTGELEFAKYLRDNGFEARRGQQHKGGIDSPDVITDMTKLQWEVKRVEALNLHKAMEKLALETDFMDIPVIAHRKNGTPWLATLPMTRFIRMYQVLKNRNLLGQL